MTKKQNKKPMCYECGQPLSSWTEKHTIEDCNKYKRKVWLEGLQNAIVTFPTADPSIAYVNVPLEFPKVWLVITAQVHKKEV